MSKFTIYDFVVADRAMIASGKRYSFRSYTDRVGIFGNPGAEVFYNDGSKDKSGRLVGKGFAVDQSHYKLQAREGQVDYDQKPMFKFFMYAPFCEGSPNGDYSQADGGYVPLEKLLNIDENLKRLKTGELVQHGVKIKLMDTELDAEVATDVTLRRAEAQISVGQLDEETLADIAALSVGMFGEVDKTMRYKVLEFAGRRPIDYFNYLNAGDRGLRALIRKAISEGVLKQKGSLIYWENTLIGNDEDGAVATLNSDPKMLDGLKSKVPFKIADKKSAKKNAKA
jgi:hypothetical protein